MFMSLFFNFFILQVWQGLLKFSENYLNLDLQITPFFKNKHFELCCFVMYRVRNIVNRRESDVICQQWYFRILISTLIRSTLIYWGSKKKGNKSKISLLPFLSLTASFIIFFWHLASCHHHLCRLFNASKCELSSTFRCLFVVVLEHCCFVYISHSTTTKVAFVWYGASFCCWICLSVIATTTT